MENEHEGKPNDTTMQVRLPTAQKREWTEHAKELTGGSRAAFVRGMVEAGRKKFSNEVQPDETANDIRRERNRLRRENEDLRAENERLLNRLDTAGERGVLKAYLRENGEATFSELQEAVSGGVTERLNDHIDALIADGQLRADPAPEDTSPLKLDFRPSEAKYRLTEGGEDTEGADE